MSSRNTIKVFNKPTPEELIAKRFTNYTLPKKKEPIVYNTGDFVTDFDDIKRILNGYARVIEYGSKAFKSNHFNPASNPEENFIISVSEGHLLNGIFEGYMRELNNEGECKVGFHKS